MSSLPKTEIREGATGTFASALGSLVGELTRVLGCHTVILYGSRARGDADANSDVDLLAIGQGVPDGPYIRQRSGLDFDAWVADEKTIDSDLDEFLKIEDGRVLMQKADYGDLLLRRVASRMAEGPAALSIEERAQRIHWLHRMAERALRDDDEGRYRHNWLLTELPQVYFELDRRFWLGPKRSLRLLEKIDPAFLSMYRRALSEIDPTLLVPCIEKLIESTSRLDKNGIE